MNGTMHSKPIVLALMGLPGAGKSTLARALSARLGWTILSRDEIREAMFRPCTHSEMEKQAAVEATFDAVAQNVASGFHTIIDGMTFSRLGQLETLESRVMRHGGILQAVVLECPIPVAQARIAKDRDKKKAMPGDRDEDLVIRVAKRFRPYPDNGIVLDAKKPVARLVEEVLCALPSGHEGV